MKKISMIIIAEIIKQHRNWFHSKFIYFSLLVWPTISFYVAYYNYKPFILVNSVNNLFSDANSLMMFLITGYIGWICFWSLMQSAMQMGFERVNGTLETIFLSPANRIALMYGRALGALFENIWTFLVFSLFILFWIEGIHLENWYYLPLSFLIVFTSAVIWGAFLNVIFLFTRDAGIVYDICDEPMHLFSGVAVPPMVFPVWAKIISVAFPLTHCLYVSRSLTMSESIGSVQDLGSLIIVNVVFIVLTVLLLRRAENHYRRTGNLTFY